MDKVFEHVPVELTEMQTVNKDGGRKYITPEDVALPSITTVLSILSRDGIAAWRKRVGEEEANRISRIASQRGTAVHSCMEDFINNVPMEELKKKYMPNIIEDWLPIAKIAADKIGKVYAQEAPLYSNHLGVAGRVDCVAEYDGRISIIDFKTSRKKKYPSMIKNYFMQEAAYAIMWEERTGQPITQLVTIIAVDEYAPQVFIEHRDNWVRPLKETIAQYNEENSGSLFL